MYFKDITSTAEEIAKSAMEAVAAAGADAYLATKQMFQIMVLAVILILILVRMQDIHIPLINLGYQEHQAAFLKAHPQILLLVIVLPEVSLQTPARGKLFQMAVVTQVAAST